MGFREDLTGKNFNNLKVLDFDSNKGGRTYWKCRCICGNICIAEAYKIKSGHTKSCGCLSEANKKKLRENSIKHQKTNTKLYRVWQNMKRRCDTPSLKSYKHYGGRGITVCKEWRNDFMNFYNWAINNGYKENLTIERIDVNGNYQPNNCRWATAKEQANNKRNNKFVKYKDKKLSINQWSEKTGIKRETIAWRLKHDFPLEKVFAKENFAQHTKFKKKEEL